MGSKARCIGEHEEREQGRPHRSRRGPGEQQVDQHWRSCYPNDRGGDTWDQSGRDFRCRASCRTGRGIRPRPRRRRHPSSAAKARIVAPTSARTTTGSAYWKATRPSGKPARLPSPSRNSSPGAIARHNPGSATNDSAVEMMMTSWIARGGSTNSKKNGAAERQSQNRSPCRALLRPLSSRPTRPSQAGSLRSRNGSSGGSMIRTHCAAALPRAGPASPTDYASSPLVHASFERDYAFQRGLSRGTVRPPLGGAALRRSIKDGRFGRGGRAPRRGVSAESSRDGAPRAPAAAGSHRE